MKSQCVIYCQVCMKIFLWKADLTANPNAIIFQVPFELNSLRNVSVH